MIYFKPKQALIASIAVIILIFALNFHLIISNGKIVNNTVSCYESDYYEIYPFWEKVLNLTLYLVSF